VESTVEAVLEWVRKSAAPRFPDLDVRADTLLIDSGVLDSIEILNLVGFLEERFGIALPVEEFVPENFRDPETVARLVLRLAAAKAG